MISGWEVGFFGEQDIYGDFHTKVCELSNNKGKLDKKRRKDPIKQGGKSANRYVDITNQSGETGRNKWWAWGYDVTIYGCSPDTLQQVPWISPWPCWITRRLNFHVKCTSPHPMIDALSHINMVNLGCYLNQLSHLPSHLGLFINVPIYHPIIDHLSSPALSPNLNHPFQPFWFRKRYRIMTCRRAAPSGSTTIAPHIQVMGWAVWQPWFATQFM
jgi:hypothetical protein